MLCRVTQDNAEKKLNPGTLSSKYSAYSPLSKQASKTRCPFLAAPVCPGGVTASLLTFPSKASSPPVSLPVKHTAKAQHLTQPERASTDEDSERRRDLRNALPRICYRFTQILHMITGNQCFKKQI